MWEAAGPAGRQPGFRRHCVGCSCWGLSWCWRHGRVDTTGPVPGAHNDQAAQMEEAMCPARRQWAHNLTPQRQRCQRRQCAGAAAPAGWQRGLQGAKAQRKVLQLGQGTRQDVWQRGSKASGCQGQPAGSGRQNAMLQHEDNRANFMRQHHAPAASPSQAGERARGHPLWRYAGPGRAAQPLQHKHLQPLQAAKLRRQHPCLTGGRAAVANAGTGCPARLPPISAAANAQHPARHKQNGILSRVEPAHCLGRA